MPDREKIIQGLEHEIERTKVADTEWLDCVEVALLRDALALLKAQEPAFAYWIHCDGKSHIWYCSKCGEKINYNDARRTYKTEKKPVEAVNRYCRGCGATMVPRPTEAQKEAIPWRD